MSSSSIYCTLYSLKQNKNMSPRTYKFTMHAVTFLKGSDADVLTGIIRSAWTAEQHVTKRSNSETFHIPLHSLRCSAWVWFGNFFFFFCLATKFFSGSGEKWKVRSGLHELAACQDKHLVIQRWHLLARLRWNFLLDAAQNGKVAQNKKVNIWRGQPTVRLMLLPFFKMC